jgi:hypothetical protein
VIAEAIAAYHLNGASICSGMVDDATQTELCDEFGRLSEMSSTSHRSGSVFGIRGLLRKSPIVAGHAWHGPLARLAQSLTGPDTIPVRAIFFDKTQDANWPLPWHQDRTAALHGTTDAAEFKNWTVKDGVSHAELPLSYLQAMVTLRVHLDPCDAETVALLVLIGHHRGAVLSDAEMRQLSGASTPQVLAVDAGDTVIVSPLTPHASRRTTRPSRRRVLHIEYCAKRLPAGVEWQEVA